MSAPAPWPRPHFAPSELRAQALFVCFHEGSLADVPLTRQHHGLPLDVEIDRIDVRVHERQQVESWLTGWWHDAFGVVARRDLGAEFEGLQRSDGCTTLQFTIPDAPDHGVLQATWGLVRWLVARGARYVFDVHALRWWTAPGVRALGFDDFDAERELSFVVENDAVEAETRRLVHTRGLCKVARPDLLVWVEPSGIDTALRLLRAFAHRLADGWRSEGLVARLGAQEVVTAEAAERRLLDDLGLAEGVLVRFRAADRGGLGRGGG